jgi:competence protein ComEC
MALFRTAVFAVADRLRRQLLPFLLLVFGILSHSAYADWVVPTDRVTNRVIVREQPSSNSTDIGSLRPGQRLEWIQDVPKWREVRLDDGQTGFVTKSYTEVVEAPAAAAPEIAVHFLATGTGSCAIVECPGPDAPPMILDCGSLGRSNSDLDTDQARDYIGAILDARPGIRPNLVLSHPDRDHHNLIPDVLPQQVDQIWMGGDSAGYTAAGFENWLSNQVAGRATVHDETDIPPDFYNDQQPVESLACGEASTFVLTANAGTAPNARSIVIQIEHGEFSVIFTGDATGETEARAMANYHNAVSTTVLTGSHHGAGTHGSNGTSSQSSAWREMTQPKIMVYQSGTRFGHPRCTVTDSYDAFTVEAAVHPFHCGLRNGSMPDVAREETVSEAKYVTSRNGTIVIRSDGRNFVRIDCEQTPECGSTLSL